MIWYAAYDILHIIKDKMSISCIFVRRKLQKAYICTYSLNIIWISYCEFHDFDFVIIFSRWKLYPLVTIKPCFVLTWKLALARVLTLRRKESKVVVRFKWWFNPIIIIKLFITLKFIAIKTTVLAHIIPNK